MFYKPKLVKAIIIDDEKIARQTTRLMVETFCPDVSIVDVFNNVDKGAEYLHQHDVDIVFLDIDMPKKNGFELFNLVDCSRLQIIMVTGHNEYAVKAFKYAACHYLLKPLIPEELIAACQTAKSRIAIGTAPLQIEYLQKIIKDKTANFPSSIVISTKSEYEIVNIVDIIRFEGERNYTWVHTAKGKLLTTKTLKEYEEILNPNAFYRIHQSHYINRLFIRKIMNQKTSSMVILENETSLPLSRHRKRDFIHWIEQNQL